MFSPFPPFDLVMGMWEAGSRPGGGAASVVKRMRRKRKSVRIRCRQTDLRSASEGRERRRTKLQTRAKQMATEQQRAEKAREMRRCGRKGRGCVRTRKCNCVWHGSGPVGFWKGPQRRARYHSRPGPFLGASPARCGPVGTGRLQGARAGIGRGCSTAFAQYLHRDGAQGTEYFPGPADTWRMWHSAGCC